MDADRLARVASVLGRADGGSVVDGLLELSVQMLGLSGASIAVIGDGQHLGRFAAAGEVGSVIDELQFTLGEGPGVTADSHFGAVLEPDLTTAFGAWPAFAEAALAQGVSAVFAFPLRVGAARLGVLSLYRSEAGELERDGSSPRPVRGAEPGGTVPRRVPLRRARRQRAPARS